MDEWEKFQGLILDETERVLGSNLEEHWDELKNTIWNKLYDTSGRTTMDIDLDSAVIFFGKIFHGYIEIINSVHTLKDIHIYISSFPYKNKSITKPRYIRYHIENYFNEVYLLKLIFNSNKIDLF